MNRLTLFFISILVFWLAVFGWINSNNVEIIRELSPYKDLYHAEIKSSRKLKDDAAYWKSRAIVAESTLNNLEGIKSVPKELRDIKRNLRKLTAVKDSTSK